MIVLLILVLTQIGIVRPNPVRTVRNAQFSRVALIVLLIPADGIENELPIRPESVMQWLAIDDVMRNIRDELRRQCIERLGIFSMYEPVTFQCATDAGKVNDGLIISDSFYDWGQYRRQHSGLNCIKR